MKPQMSEKEIEVIERILSSYGTHIDVLEWGSGGSTVYFTNYLAKKGISYTWLSLEYNRKWYNKIAEATKDDPDTNIVLFDVGNDELRQPDIPMNEYVAYPGTLGKKYDVVLVDGRKRRRCVLEAKDLLKKGGRVLLHDARRTFYHSAFNAFPDGRMLLWTGLWQGRPEDPGFVRKVINFFAYWSFRVYTFSFRFRI